MIIGVILMVALWLAHETKSLLIGEGADKEMVQDIRGLVGAQSQVRNIDEITTLHMGPEFVLVNMRLRFDDTAPACEVEQVTDYSGRADPRSVSVGQTCLRQGDGAEPSPDRARPAC